MMKTPSSYLVALSLLFLAQFQGVSQEIHSPVEIMQILETSDVSYVLHTLETEIETPDRSTLLTTVGYYRKIENDQIQTLEYLLSEEGYAHYTKAEELFEAKAYAEAKEMYLKLLETDPNYYTAMTFIGQINGIEGDFETAIEWYKKSIDNNYIDYLAHWFLADAYASLDQPKKALKEITVAQILNRNNLRIQASFKRIYEQNKLKAPDWSFTPQIKLEEGEEGEANIYFHADWLGYSLAKALWKFEPGYSESMGVAPGTLSTIEEREAIASLAITLIDDKKKTKKHPEFNALVQAVMGKMSDEFIFYEIILPDYPDVAFQLSEEFIEDIRDYVIKVRGEK